MPSSHHWHTKVFTYAYWLHSHRSDCAEAGSKVRGHGLSDTTRSTKLLDIKCTLSLMLLMHMLLIKFYDCLTFNV